MPLNRQDLMRIIPTEEEKRTMTVAEKNSADHFLNQYYGIHQRTLRWRTEEQTNKDIRQTDKIKECIRDDEYDEAHRRILMLNSRIRNDLDVCKIYLSKKETKKK